MIFAVFIPFIIICFIIFFIFDCIIRIQYKNHYLEWQKDGKPHGIFFIPKESKSFGGIFIRLTSSFAQHRRALSLLWKTPEWASDETEVKKLIFWYRILSILGFLIWLGFVYPVMFIKEQH